MIDWVNDRLIEWARWLRADSDGGRGYQLSSMNRWYRPGFADGSSSAAVIPINDIQASRTNRAVMALQPMRRSVVELYYVSGYQTTLAMAERLKISSGAFYGRLHAAHLELDDLLRGRR